MISNLQPGSYRAHAMATEDAPEQAEVTAFDLDEFLNPSDLMEEADA